MGRRLVVSYLHPVQGFRSRCADMLVVDESNSVPVSVLRMMLGLCSVFFLSTLYGGCALRRYCMGTWAVDGAGLCCGISFYRSRSMVHLHLCRPVRYSSFDEVER